VPLIQTAGDPLEFTLRNNNVFSSSVSKVRTLIPSLLLSAVAPLAAAPAHYASGPARVALIELYTSEGCSSCPPADAWLGGLLENPGLWSQFVPVQFHVDYWDGLGWKDRLASRENTARQYAYASAWGARSVYTPCFVRDGEEWKPRLGFPPAAPAPPAGILALDLLASGLWGISFTPGPGGQPASQGYEVHLAHLGFGISSRVTAGENAGATLEHDFVVLAFASRPLVADAPGGALRATLDLTPAPAISCARRAIAAWVTPKGGLAPVQAAGGWLP
jgi:hypothetical protein